ncbi:ion transporter [Alkalilimnicola sp. S0819]|uniref:ion transporter n=1 Tax=Alkalilimnicola sp. S0819 TaxID=2613922 RepID=UPI0012623998|nr:ion transporter [Alkalilimnicola sp. S0819]KAB7623923.1 ion transporter [Alkalilimnicola sp. S0819]MPQ16520.1 ion transporter [Alkalilimnicola sp. S0819]
MPDIATFRARLGQWIDSPIPHHAIIALITLNAITLGLETSQTVTARYGEALHLLDRALIAVFTLEIALKLIAWGPRFFRNGWNVFDLLVVGVSLIPTAGPLSVLRSLRVLRVLRLVSSMGRLRIIVDSLLHALPGIGWIGVLLGLVFYVFAVMGVGLFGAAFPEWFGTIPGALYSLFQIMTLESWSMGIVRPVMEQYPYAWLYFIPFILMTTFTVLNLFIGIIVNSMQELHAAEEKRLEERERRAHTEREDLLAQVSALQAQMRRLEQALRRQR